MAEPANPPRPRRTNGAIAMLLLRACLHVSGGGVIAHSWLGAHADWFLLPGLVLVGIGLLADWLDRAN